MRVIDAGFRRADASDLVALRDLERAASLAALGHLFDPARHPYPSDEVLARWALVLDEPGVVVDVVDDPDAPGQLLALTAYDATSLRHLAVAPAAWGSGLARSAVARAVAGIAAAGASEARLTCLVENHRARGLYEHLGWQPTAVRGEAPWPPYPAEMEYVLPLDPSLVSG